MTRLDTIYFVYKNVDEWDARLGEARFVDPLAVAGGFPKGHDCWIIQPYLHLRQRGHDVRLVPAFQPNAINVVFYDHLRAKDFPISSFVVAVQPDRPRPEICNARLVQNHGSIVDPTTDWHINLYPESNIIPRDPDRGPELRTLAYFGRPFYLAPRFRANEFRRQLARMGVTFILRHKEWNNYRDVDGVLAVRDVPEIDLAIKPPNKLFNAWHGEVVPFLGVESAYRHLRQSPLDYFEVATPDDVCDAIQRLRSDDSLMGRMVENGRRRREAFTADAITNQWESLLSGPIRQAFERWRRLPRPVRTIIETVRYPWFAYRHRRARARFWDERRPHYRKIGPLSDAPLWVRSPERVVRPDHSKLGDDKPHA